MEDGITHGFEGLALDDVAIEVELRMERDVGRGDLGRFSGKPIEWRFAIWRTRSPPNDLRFL